MTSLDNLIILKSLPRAVKNFFIKLGAGVNFHHSSQKGKNLLVFSDLDGTLLDHQTYSFEPALPALELLQKENIPLVICTSKTRAEIEKVRRQLRNKHPFISENGGAIFIPQNYFSFTFSFDKQSHEYLVIELGTSYSLLRDIFQQIRSSLSANIKGFGDLSPEEIAQLCDFSLSEAELARDREYDEPFILEDESLLQAIEDQARRSGLQIVRGGRFYHLLGKNDKGGAVKELKSLFEKKSSQVKTIALGDSRNDLAMLEAVDFPVLIPKKDGSYDLSINLSNLFLASSSGPHGWNEAMMKILDELF